MLKIRLKRLKTPTFPQFHTLEAVENVKFSTLLTDFSTFLLKTTVNYSLCIGFCIYRVLFRKRGARDSGLGTREYAGGGVGGGRKVIPAVRAKGQGPRADAVERGWREEGVVRVSE